MATTDARPGFKLPWSAERTESDTPDAAATAAPVPDAAAESPNTSTAPAAGDPPATPVVPGAPDPWRLAAMPPVPASDAPRRKPNKLMADLTRAMQSAAETARIETLERLEVDAKAFIESVHARSGTEAEALRQTADEDIASIREWSKAEIARIREETDERIAGRKTSLEAEIEAHAARIAAQIERVEGHVAWFETEMAGFFERLLAEDDPTRLAAMAENLPEPPAFDDLPDLPVDALATPVAETAPDTAPDAPAVAALDTSPADLAPDAAAPGTEAEAATTESTAPAVAVETQPVPAGTAPTPSPDPRFAALGLTPEAAAEAEAEAEVDPTEDIAEIETFSDDALNARLTGLVPGEGDAPQTDQRTTRVIVTGLVSVASIASFKRHLGRLEGTTSVGVSSGPDGEFIFAVAHGPGLDIAGALPALPGFAAHVTDSTHDAVTVAARDPETAS